MGYIRIYKVNKEISQSAPFNRFGGVLRKARSGRVALTFSHDVGRKRDDGDVWMVVLFFPGADLPAGFVAIFVGHLDVALGICVRGSSVSKAGQTEQGTAYYYYRVVEGVMRED